MYDLDLPDGSSKQTQFIKLIQPLIASVQEFDDLCG